MSRSPKHRLSLKLLYGLVEGSADGVLAILVLAAVVIAALVIGRV